MKQFIAAFDLFLSLFSFLNSFLQEDASKHGVPHILKVLNGGFQSAFMCITFTIHTNIHKPMFEEAMQGTPTIDRFLRNAVLAPRHRM